MSLINDALRRASQVQKQNPGGPAPMAPLHPVDHPKSNLLPYVIIPLFVLSLLGLAGLGAWHFFGKKKDPSLLAKQKAGQTSPVTSTPAQTNRLVATSPTPPTARQNTVPAAKPPATKPAQTSPSTPAVVAKSPATNRPVGTAVNRPTVTTTNRSAGTTTPSRPPTASATNRVPVSSSPQATPPPTVTPGTPPATAPVATATPSVPAKAPASTPAPVEWPPLKLQGVIMTSASPKAFINGDEFMAGEKTDEGVKIVSIQRNKVVVEFQGITKTLVIK